MWKGKPNQKAAIEALDQLGALTDLKEFDPLVAGTIPIDVDVDGSDIDIICSVVDFDRFVDRVKSLFSSHKNFLITESFSQGKRSLVARFEFSKFRIEVFGQALPSLQQNAFLHMVAEAKLLRLFGEDLRLEVRLLKSRGIKTEPAFAKILGIEGDPYTQLLTFIDSSDEAILKKYKILANPDTR